MQHISMEEAYSGVLDLDQGGPEVYETPDVPADDNDHQQSNWSSNLEPNNENIDISTLTDDAKDKFEDSQLDTSYADFSDRVGKTDYLRRRGEGLLSNVVPLKNGQGRDFGFLSYRTKQRIPIASEDFTDLSNLANIYELESVVRALTREAEHISHIISESRVPDGSKGPSEQKTLEALSRETDKVIAKLAKADLNNSYLMPETSVKDGLVIPEIKKEEVKDVQSTPYNYSFYELESKVSKIEQILGLNTQTFPSENQPIIPSVVRLSEKLALLSNVSEPAPESSSGTAQNSASSAGPKTCSSQARERTPNAAEPTSIVDDIDVEKIDKLYSAIPLLESVAPTLPNLIERLRTVQKLHTDGVDACQSVKELGSRLDMMTNDIQEWTDLLKGLVDKVDDAVQTSNKNLLRSKEYLEEQNATVVNKG